MIPTASEAFATPGISFARSAVKRFGSGALGLAGSITPISELITKRTTCIHVFTAENWTRSEHPDPGRHTFVPKSVTLKHEVQHLGPRYEDEAGPDRHVSFK